MKEYQFAKRQARSAGAERPLTQIAPPPIAWAATHLRGKEGSPAIDVSSSTIMKVMNLWRFVTRTGSASPGVAVKYSTLYHPSAGCLSLSNTWFPR